MMQGAVPPSASDSASRWSRRHGPSHRARPTSQLELTVQRIRRTRGWSQEELAFLTGLDRTHISGIERGQRDRTITVLKGLADVPAVPPEALLDTDTPLPGRQRTDPASDAAEALLRGDGRGLRLPGGGPRRRANFSGFLRV
jgi:transcriptional regulator with XRE-family HTH domain